MKTASILIVSLALLLSSAWAWAEAPVSVQVSPETIDINTTFNGTTLRVTGSVPAGADVVLRMTGAPGDLHMKRKGKALGLLWMNMNAVTFHGVPSLYLVAGSKPLEALGAVGESLRPKAVLRNVQVDPAPDDTSELLDQLITLKVQEKLYQTSAASVTLGEATSGRQPFTAEFRIPSRLSAGTYRFEAIAVRDGALDGATTRELKAELISTPRFLSNLAFGHGALYGVLATIIAIVSGLAVGLVFQSKGAH